jgi:hypothetical protein
MSVTASDQGNQLEGASVDAGIASDRARGSSSAADLLRIEDFEMVQPAWADFPMEAAYWHALDEICAAKGLSARDFIVQLERDRPAESPAAIVRHEIIFDLARRHRRDGR